MHGSRLNVGRESDAHSWFQGPSPPDVLPFGGILVQKGGKRTVPLKCIGLAVPQAQQAEGSFVCKMVPDRPNERAATIRVDVSVEKTTCAALCEQRFQTCHVLQRLGGAAAQPSIANHPEKTVSSSRNPNCGAGAVWKTGEDQTMQTQRRGAVFRLSTHAFQE